MKILYVITDLGIGGAERLVINLADKMAYLGHQVCIVVLTDPILFTPSDLRIQIVALNMTKAPWDFARAYFAFRRVIVEFQPDVIHSHMVHANLLARLIKLVVGVPRLICTAHSKNEGGRLRMLAYRLTDSLANVSTNVSCEAVRAFEIQGAVPVGKMLAVVNGIDCDVFRLDTNSRIEIRQSLSIKDGCIVFIAVGRLYEVKDYPNLLNAYSLSCISNPNSCLWIIGDGPLRKELEELAISLEIRDTVHFFGVRHDIPKLMSAADVFVLSSVWEGLPLVVGEAMATGCLVVATDCGGVKELVGSSGYLVSPSDSVSLSKAMSEVANLSNVTAEYLRVHARQRIVEGFGLDSAAKRWLEIYSC